MTGRRIILSLIFCLSMALMALLSPEARSASLPERHPMEVENGLCSECHDDKDYGIEHLPGWFGEHRFRAAQNNALCSMCHAQSFCADCHAGKEEMKPSDKFTESPLRGMPHRGDYITRHKIDAKINPAPCFRCHGRGNNGKCKLCHI